MGERILCLDFDDVLIKTKQVVEPILRQINPCSSDDYLEFINKRVLMGLIDEDEKREMEEKHFDMKDRVLEEACPEYENIIDYDRVISIENIYSGAIEYVKSFLDSDFFDKVCIVSHCNVDREVEAKYKFINRYLGGIIFIPVPFHIEPYGLKDRVRSSKALYVKRTFDIDSLENCFLLDDSLSNLKDWEKHDGQAVLFRPLTEKEQFRGSAEKVISGYPRIMSFSEDDVIMPLIRGTSKIKKRW